jgi:tetratricopeptide (TPR) repeat protein
MKKYFLTVAILFAATAFAQTGKKQTAKEKAPTQKEMDKIMAEAMANMSPEEKKRAQDAMQMGKEMQKKGMTGNMSAGNVPAIPRKQTGLLNKMPVLSSQQQYNAYLVTLLSECKRNIQPEIITGVDALIQDHDNADARVNIAPALFLQKKPAAAVYAAIRTAMLSPGDVLLQDNLAVLLHQTGYPQKALPILQYIVPQNNYPLILNNLGQSYLSLGDTANARKFFLACLAKDPNQCDANCAMAFMLSEQGKINEAAAYLIKSLKNGYTEMADDLLKKNKTTVKYKDIRQEVPEFFNPQKYKPVPPAYSMETVELTEALRNEMELKMREWDQKREQVNEEQSKMMEKESLIQIGDRTRGYLSNTPFAKKAQLMVELLGIEFGEFVAKDYKNEYLKIENEYSAQLEKKLKDMYGGSQHYENEYEDCVKKIEILNGHLPLSAKNHEAYQRKTLSELYEWTNQSLYWWYFLTNKEQYKIHFHELVSYFFDRLHDYDQMQNLHPTPLWITTTCKDVKEPVKIKITEDSLEMYCPVSVKVPILIGSYKQDCNGMEIEGGELLMLGFQEDYKTGEFSFAFGLGAEARLAIFSAGTKGQMFFRFAKDFSPLDCGLKFETGGDANILGLNIEEKIVGVMGMASGVHVDVINPGKTTTIFEMDPSK